VGASGVTVDVVIPTTGRATLRPLVAALLEDPECEVRQIVVVDDRPATRAPALPEGLHGLDGLRDAAAMTDTAAVEDDEADAAAPSDRTRHARVRVLRSHGRGPAGARNAGWRASDAEWIAFLDDDVVLPEGWLLALHRDLERADADVAAVQGRIVVPLPTHRRPTDWERNVAGLEHAQWATADMAIRRSVLASLDGFDERFPRAYREDADLGLRITALGHRIAMGERHVLHPPANAPWHVSIRKQRGNADDALMRRLHGPHWRERAAAPRGRLRRHVAVTAAGTAAVVGAVAGRRRLAGLAAAAWLAGTAELATRRIAPGPRNAREVASMLATSAVLPVAATVGWCRGAMTARHVSPHRVTHRRFDAVLFDRDGTLVVDVPYNGDPSLVEPMPKAAEALARLRAAGIATGVVTNQSGIGRGIVSMAGAVAVNARVDELLGPFDVWQMCPHAPDAGCACRKPSPGLIRAAAAALGSVPERCVVVGDIGSDVEAARAAGATAILVPTDVTRAEEIDDADLVAPDLRAAVDLVLTIGRRG
jgi:HAD superfamily hydrolase (TIGR01662 family)